MTYRRKRSSIQATNKLNNKKDIYVFGSAFSTQHVNTNQLISFDLGVSAKRNGVD